jgi:rfaE bifunctional protein kinase chain/domain
VKQRKVREICRLMKKATVTVVGDMMLDRYIWGQVDRISPEAPVPVVNVEKTNMRLGGAANVAWNIASLGARVRLVGCVGKDQTGRELRKLLSSNNLTTEFIVTDSNRVTTEKIRVLAHNQQVVRADFESGGEIGSRAIARLGSSIRRAVDGSAAVVVSDYGKGVVSSLVMDSVRQAADRDGIPILVDPKEGHFSLYRGAFVVTPNKKEAGGFYNVRIRSEDDLERVGVSLLTDLEAAALLITRGEEGMTLFEKGRRPRHFPTRASEVYDVTGAGDTVISVLAAALAAGVPIYQSIELANAGAGIVVRELGTAAVTPEELVRGFPA